VIERQALGVEHDLSARPGRRALDVDGSLEGQLFSIGDDLQVVMRGLQRPWQDLARINRRFVRFRRRQRRPGQPDERRSDQHNDRSHTSSPN
jgi:hypothetical protein